ILYTYLHLAPEPELTKALAEKKVIGVAYETIENDDGTLPLLRPMSEVAGRMAVQVGANVLQKEHGGKGVLLGGVPGTRRGRVVVDVAVDQGGCIETCRPTTHDNPTYEIDGVVHYCVANMPGAVAQTSTWALTNTTMAYALKIADLGIVAAAKADRALLKGI